MSVIEIIAIVIASAFFLAILPYIIFLLIEGIRCIVKGIVYGWKEVIGVLFKK